MKKKVLTLMIAAAMTFGLVGCGSAAKEEEPIAETPADETQTGEDKVWIIGTDTAFKPFEYKDDTGKFVGIDVDILAAVAKDQGFQYEL